MRGMGLTLPACVHFESGRAQKFTSPELHPPSLTPCLLDMLAVRPSLSSALPHMDRYGAARCNGKGSLGFLHPCQTLHTLAGLANGQMSEESEGTYIFHPISIPRILL